MRVHVSLPLLLAPLLLTSHFAAAQTQQTDEDNPDELELTLSNDTIQLLYLTDGEAINVDRGQLSGGFFLSEDRDVVGMAGLLVPADLELGQFSLLFGPRVYAALLDEENNDVLSVAIGAELRFDILREHDLAVVGSAFYAPDILTFGSADKLTDLLARVEVRVAPKLIGFAGMRWFELDLLMGENRTLQEELIAGLRWQFK